MPGPNTGHNITPLNLFSVAGKITDGTNPVAGAQVTLQDAQSRTVRGSQFLTGLTNATGDFTLNGAMPGWYFLQTFNSGSTNFLLNKNTPIFLVNGNVTGQNIVVGKGAKGTFTVTHNGTPVFFAQVTGYNSGCTEGRFNGFTDQAGVFRSITFPAGDARVWVTTANYPDIGDNAASCQTAPLVNFPVEVNTPLDVSLPDGTPVTGQRVFGRVIANNPTDGIPFASVILRNNAGTRSFFEFTDYCGDWEVMNVPPDTYDVSFSANGFAGKSDNDGVIVTNAEVNDGVTTLNRLTGSIEGHFRDAAGDPIMGATACAIGTGGRCAQNVSDNTGYYTINGLADGAYPMVGRAYGRFDPQLRAVNTTVSGGGSVEGVDFNLPNVPVDTLESGDLTAQVPLLPHRPDAGASMAQLRPNGTPITRSFRDLEDVDWFRFAVTAGQKYTVTITGPVSSVFGFFRGVFDSATKLPDAVAAAQILTGWTAPATGERMLALSSAFSSRYTITLTEGTLGPPPPTLGSINPTSGPAGGGTSVTLTGTNFVAGTTVKFGTQNATSVVIVNATTITCKSPALATGGTLYDVTVNTPASAVVVGEVSPHAPEAAATLVKGWFADFTDVPTLYLYHTAIEKIVRAGITSGCGGGKYCPGDAITRDAMAVFILKGKNGSSFNPPDATGTVFEDVKKTTFLSKWMEAFGNGGITTGCGTTPGKTLPNYCPTGLVTRDGMSVFLERGKKGASFNPPGATGTIFCDVQTTTFLSKWMEQLKSDNITQGCGSGPCPRLGGTKPTFCPLGTVTRGEMAPFIVRAFGL